MKQHLYFPLIIVSILLACGNSQNKEIEQVLELRETALETNDVDLYLTLFSENYSEEREGQNVGLQDIKKNFQDTFPIFRTLDISNTDRSIYIKGEKADVFQINRVEAKIDDKSVFQIKEKIALEKIGDKWLIIKESDADYFTGYAFGNIE